MNVFASFKQRFTTSAWIVTVPGARTSCHRLEIGNLVVGESAGEFKGRRDVLDHYHGMVVEYRRD